MGLVVSVLSLLLIVTFLLLLKNIKLNKRLLEIASHDSLTGILTRRYFIEFGLTQTDRSLRLKKECFLIMFDLDHFKVVNDTYGHQAGDQVLKDITQRVKSAIRPYDLFGRYGGEEFVILMFDTDKANTISATERIRQAVCKTPVEFEGKQISISASFGIAFVAPKNDIETAIKHADEALYSAKAKGRNTVIFYEQP
ncbi:MAG: GGDEF domain-containing protein [Treponema sp.]|nr:GGDEF domain-containing protein [Treponema sp.]